MNNDIKVSIIMPVYNVEKYLNESLDSVCNQTLKEIEIICIDDGSSDMSYQILEEYSKNDSRIKVVHQENRGYGYALNSGFKLARGNYIGILEPDDYIDLYMMEKLYYKATENDLEVVKSNFAEFNGSGENKKIIYKKLVSDESVYNKIVEPSGMSCLYRGYIMNPSGIYKKDFLKKYNILHNETPGASFQDQGFWFQVMTFAKKMLLINNCLYFYRQDNPNSSISSKEKIYCICDEYKFIYEKLKDKEKWAIVLPKFVCCMNSNYRNTFYRISKMYRKDFLFRMQTDFMKLKSEGQLDSSFLTDKEKIELEKVINDYELYYNKYLDYEVELNNLVKRFKYIIIYGAGVIGRRVYDNLSEKNKDKVIGFAVSGLDESFFDIDKKPIKNINLYADFKHVAAVLIGVGDNYKVEIQQNLKSMCFSNVIELPEIINIG